MKALLPRLRLVALLVALLPGLLLVQGEHLRVCLHALLGVDAACTVTDSAEARGSCCAPAPEGPSVTSQELCPGCCVDIAGHSRERAAPAPNAATSVVATLALPPTAVLALPDRVLVRAPWVAAPPAVASASGRAPTPLRI